MLMNSMLNFQTWCILGTYFSCTNRVPKWEWTDRTKNVHLDCLHKILFFRNCMASSCTVNSVPFYLTKRYEYLQRSTLLPYWSPRGDTWSKKDSYLRVTEQKEFQNGGYFYSGFDYLVMAYRQLSNDMSVAILHRVSVLKLLRSLQELSSRSIILVLR